MMAEMENPSHDSLHTAFLRATRKHVFMLSTHGMHQWKIVPGLPDTGGQNVFVNQFSQALVDQGFKVTIVNRGGYEHPSTKRHQGGLDYKDAHQRILYLEDGLERFVRKEEMADRVPSLVECLLQHLHKEGSSVDLIFSNYWDAASVGVGLVKVLEHPPPHYWIPHSLGCIKKRNVPRDQHQRLRVDERIVIEVDLVNQVDGLLATSRAIHSSLLDDYNCAKPIYSLPPCVDPERFHPRAVSSEAEIWTYLSQRSQLATKEIQERKIITEISRTDRTKRKDLLLRAYAQIRGAHPDAFLVLSIDENKQPLSTELWELIEDLQIRSDMTVVGSIYDLLPDLYAVTAIYCTPSVMEGFGMSAQEAAACKVPVVASEKVPFAGEVLLGEGFTELQGHADAAGPVFLGKGAILVPAEDSVGLAQALDVLLSDDDLRARMGEAAYQLTIPYFTWPERVRELLAQIELQG
jgi:glycosyltransferase involved in cell wall biosynthesis